jgi:hypothetical protein
VIAQSRVHLAGNRHGQDLCFRVVFAVIALACRRQTRVVAICGATACGRFSDMAPYPAGVRDALQSGHRPTNLNFWVHALSRYRLPLAYRSPLTAFLFNRAGQSDEIAEKKLARASCCAGLICALRPDPLSKIFPFTPDPNQIYISAVPSHRGAYRDRHGRGAGCSGRGRRF